MIFIKVISTSNEREKSKLKKIIQLFLERVLPKANPDFEEKIPLVASWLLEFNNEDSIPNREIGLGKDGKILVKMPDNRNQGYWVDNNLVLKDFKRNFKVEFLTKNYFETMWALDFLEIGSNNIV